MINASKINLSSETPGLAGDSTTTSLTFYDGNVVMYYIGSVTLPFPTSTSIPSNQFISLSVSMDIPFKITNGSTLRLSMAVGTYGSTDSFNTQKQLFSGNMVSVQYPINATGGASGPYWPVNFYIYANQSGNSINITATRWNTGGNGVTPVTYAEGQPRVVEVYGSIYKPSD